MSSPLISPRFVEIDDLAAAVGITPQTVLRYHEIGLLPEPERGSDDRRRYGHREMVRLLWIGRMIDAGMSMDEIHDWLADTTFAEARGMGLLSDLVARRLASLPEGFIHQADLDGLLVMERIFGPLGAAIHATRLLALAADPSLRAESDRIGGEEEALDDTVAVDDPRVSRVAADRYAFEEALHSSIEKSGLALSDEALMDDEEPDLLGAAELMAKMPYDFSPARLRCMELVGEIGLPASPAV